MTGTLGNTGHQHKVRYMDCSIQIGPQPWHRMAQVCWAKTVRGQAAKHHDVGLLLDHWDITWRSHTLHQQFRGLGRNHGPFILEIRQDRQTVLRGSESLQFILLHWANPLVHSKLTKCSWQSEPCCLSRSGSMVKSYKSLTGLFDAGSWQRWPSATAARVVFFQQFLTVVAKVWPRGFGTSCCSRWWNARFVRSHSAIPRRHPQALHYTSFEPLNPFHDFSIPSISVHACGFNISAEDRRPAPSSKASPERTMALIEALGHPKQQTRNIATYPKAKFWHMTGWRFDMHVYIYIHIDMCWYILTHFAELVHWIHDHQSTCWPRCKASFISSPLFEARSCKPSAFSE